ncbi:MAG: Coenzyme F420 hydrogenase/dehydrogenase, beta subunit C-terminal domain [Candidatus Krumholzibacteriaceae bacterium]|jgi:coenzyme F420 hydrogenase subunit beta
MSVKSPVDTLLETVIETGLCTRCGTCVGACPSGNLVIADPVGACLPSERGRCASCGLCLSACPGASVDFAPLEKSLFGEAPSSRFLGVVRGAWLAHAAEARTRRAGSSGGVVTAMLIDLLARGETNGALVFAPHEKEPWRGWGRVASRAADIAAAAQSRYHLSPHNTVLADLGGLQGDYAYVGLPCQIHGLRKLESAGWHSSARISPVIGIYCGNNLYFDGTRAILRKLGIGRTADLAALSYREGAWPGSLTARTVDGRVRSISKLDFNQVIPFYVNRRCLFCVDLTSELADLSVGDGWAKEGRDGGWSVVLVRSEHGERIFDRAVVEGSIVAERITIEEAEEMHAHAFDLKKTGAFLRLRLWSGWGFAVPRYDRPTRRAGLARRMLEVPVSLQFAFASSRAGRALFAILPVRPVGRLFRLLRTLWMRSASRR